MDFQPELMIALRSRYAEPWRHYHSWQHIETLREHFDNWPVPFHSPDAVIAALLWHDAIWFPDAKDNEERSAQLLELEAASGLSSEDLRAAAMIIRATAKHQIPDGLAPEAESDLAGFLDIDLSILGASPDIFEAYNESVQREYAHVPAELYRAGRAAVLKEFLERGTLYYTATGRERWDAQARKNLAGAITALTE